MTGIGTTGLRTSTAVITGYRPNCCSSQIDWALVAQIDQERVGEFSHAGLEESGHRSSFIIPNWDEEDPQGQQQNQPLGEVVLEEEDDNEEQKQLGRKRPHHNETQQTSSDDHHYKRHERTGDGGDEDL